MEQESEREELNKNLKSLGLAGTCGRYLRRVLALYKLSRLKFSQLSYDKIIERRGSPFRVDHVLSEAAISVNPKYTLGFSFSLPFARILLSVSLHTGLDSHP